MLIIGSGGLAKQNIDLLLERGLLDKAVFFNNVDKEATSVFMGRFPLIHTMEQVAAYFSHSDRGFTVMVGGPGHRKRLQNQFVEAGGIPRTLISSKADVGNLDVSIGDGCILMTRVVVESTVTLGKGVLVNVGAIVTHDTHIGDYSEIGPAAVLCGAVKIAEGVFVGAGAVILPGVSVGAGAIIGAGAVVTGNVLAGEKVTGVPAKPMP